VTDRQLLAWFERGPRLQGSYASLAREAKLAAPQADALADISFEVIANAFTNDNTGANRDVFKGLMESCGLTDALVVFKLYAYLKGVAEDLSKGV